MEHDDAQVLKSMGARCLDRLWGLAATWSLIPTELERASDVK